MKYLEVDKILSVILVVSIIASSAILIYILVTPKADEKFTEFYILGPTGTASYYPIDIKVGEKRKVIIGIVNHEQADIIYRLKVIFNGSLIHKENIFLIENEEWEIPLTFKGTMNGKNQKLEFLLYKDQQIEAYRKIHLWISVHAREPE